MGWQGDHLAFEVEADIHPVDVPADDLTFLVQPGGRRAAGLVHRDLFDPALELDEGALGVVQGDISQRRSGHAECHLGVE